ncbi:extracellular solute-binding protein [Paenibacillus filicis]|uniref:Extracellular solute-binding protein n=1 Tax=Paenibacillus gyeongsangnamensis TaxID=3388067 RepID=A0ABT4Q3X8_9BACL|nr:extracellular solute-binding protein [Paenibacillus filicis]MCZ8511492.1 extracellular solute-binding protein [Paenibacillus filicis]
MKKVKRTLAILLSSTMVLAACGNKSQSDKPETKGAAEGEKLTSISFLTKDYYSDPEVAKILSDQFKSKTSIELNIKHIPPVNWEEKVTASFVSGDMPDLARLPANAYPFVKQDFLVPLDDYINGNKKVKAILDANPDVIKPFKYFGKTYGISVTNQKYMTMWMRTDWLDKLGLQQPKTMDELVNVLTQFRDKDLDNNGKNDTIPLTLSAVLKDQDMFAAYFNTRNQIYMKDGKAVVPFLTPEYKQYLDFMKKLYSERLIDLEMPTNKSYGAVRTKFMNGEAGAIIMWDDSYNTLKEGLDKKFPGADLAFVKPFKGDKGMFGLSYYEADSPVGITKASKNPKETFDAFFTWLLTDPQAIVSTSRGIEGYHFNLVDGTIVPNPDKGGLGFRGQSFPPLDRDFKYPIKFNKNTQTQYDNIIEMAKLGQTYKDQFTTDLPSGEFANYNNVVNDLKVKVTDLFHNYVMGKIDYDGYVTSFTNFAKEKNLQAVIDEINKK